MVEVLVREKVKEEIGAEVWRNRKLLSRRFNKVQVSYNSFGHLVLRLWNESEEVKENDEVLIVFDKFETGRIYDFVKYNLR